MEQAPEGERLCTVMDPFCGYGTTLAVANKMGMNAIGVERSKPRCITSSALNVEYNSYNTQERYTMIRKTGSGVELCMDPDGCLLIP